MGIDGMPEYLRRDKKAAEQVSHSVSDDSEFVSREIRGKRVAVDAMGPIVLVLKRLAKEYAEKLRDDEVRAFDIQQCQNYDWGLLAPRSPLWCEWLRMCMVEFSEFARRYDATLTIVVDGDDKEHKMSTAAERIKATDDARSALDMLKSDMSNPLYSQESRKKDIEKFRRSFSSMMNVSRGMRRSFTNLAAYFWDVVQAPGEAEQMCAFLVRENRVDWMWTQDSDAVAYGAPAVLRPIGGGIDYYYLEEVLAKARLTREQMIDACILAGNDLNGTQKIRGYSTKTAIEFMSKGKTLEAVFNEDQRGERALRVDRCRREFGDAGTRKKCEPHMEPLSKPQTMLIEDPEFAGCCDKLGPSVVARTAVELDSINISAGADEDDESVELEGGAGFVMLPSSRKRDHPEDGFFE